MTRLFYGEEHEAFGERVRRLFAQEISPGVSGWDEAQACPSVAGIDSAGVLLDRGGETPREITDAP